MTMSHHPSCTENDKTLGYHCFQCGEFEPAESEISALEARCEKQSRLLTICDERNQKVEHELASAKKDLEDTQAMNRAWQAKLEEAKSHHTYLEADSYLLREEINELNKKLNERNDFIFHLNTKKEAQEKWIERAVSLLKDAYKELNEIHARDGVPYTKHGWKSSVTQEWFTTVVENLRAFLGEIGIGG